MIPGPARISGGRGYCHAANAHLSLVASLGSALAEPSSAHFPILLP